MASSKKKQKTDEQEPMVPLFPDAPTEPASAVIVLADLPPNEALQSPPLRAELARSIKDHGVKVPIYVEQNVDGSYRVIDGVRRIKAARLAGFVSIDAVVEQAGYINRHVLTLSLNAQRSENELRDVSALETLFGTLIGEGTSEKDALAEIAKATGMPVGTIKSRLALTDLSALQRAALESGRMTVSTAEAVVKLRPEQRKRIDAWLKAHPDERMPGKVVKEARQVQRAAAAASFSDDLFDGPSVEALGAAATDPAQQQRRVVAALIQQAIDNVSYGVDDDTETAVIQALVQAYNLLGLGDFEPSNAQLERGLALYG